MRRIARILAALAPTLLIAAAQPAPTTIDLPGARVFSENLSTTPDGIAYVGSASGGVLRVSLKTGKIASWIKPGAYGSGSVFGVLVDPRNAMLWVCNNDLSAMGVSVAGADKGVYLKGFDLKTRAGKVSLKLPGDNAFCNDIAVARDGTVYVTSSNASQILRWRKGAAAFDIWLDDPALDAPGGGLDGIAFGSDGNLYVNNFRSNVLARVALNGDGTPGKVTILKTSRPLAVPDGLRPLGSMRFAQAEASGKIAVLTIAGETAQVDTLVEGLTAPAGVDVQGGRLWYVEAHLNHIFNPALRDKTPPPFRLASVALPKTR